MGKESDIVGVGGKAFVLTVGHVDTGDVEVVVDAVEERLDSENEEERGDTAALRDSSGDLRGSAVFSIENNFPGTS